MRKKKKAILEREKIDYVKGDVNDCRKENPASTPHQREKLHLFVGETHSQMSHQKDGCGKFLE